MIRLALRALVLALALLLPGAARAALALDNWGSNQANSNSVAVTLTTSTAGYVIAIAWSEDSTGAGTVSVSGGGLTWSSVMGPLREGTASGFIQVYGAYSAGALTGATITASYSVTAQSVLYVASFSGGVSSAPFTGGTNSLAEQGGSSYPISVTATGAAGAYIICFFRVGSTSAVTPEAGATSLFQDNNTATHYVERLTAATTGPGTYTCTPTGPYAFYLPAAFEIYGPSGSGATGRANSGMMGFF